MYIPLYMQASVGGGVGIIILLITIMAAASVIVVLLVGIARKWKEKVCGTCDLTATVSVDKCSMRILVYCTVKFYAVWRWFILSHKT